jgi:hypothetical protein
MVCYFRGEVVKVIGSCTKQQEPSFTVSDVQKEYLVIKALTWGEIIKILSLKYILQSSILIKSLKMWFISPSRRSSFERS